MEQGRDTEPLFEGLETSAKAGRGPCWLRVNRKHGSDTHLGQDSAQKQGHVILRDFIMDSCGWALCESQICLELVGEGVGTKAEVTFWKICESVLCHSRRLERWRSSTRQEIHAGK